MAERIKPQRREQETTLEELEAGLRIDKNALDDALEQYPDLFYRVSKQLTHAISIRDAIKQEVSEIEAEVDADVRADAAEKKDKVTEPEVKMMTRLDPKLIKANRDLRNATTRVNELSALKEAFQQRSYAVKDLVSLYVANYFSDQSGVRSQGSVKDHDAQIARRGMAEHRKEYARDRTRDGS